MLRSSPLCSAPVDNKCNQLLYDLQDQLDRKILQIEDIGNYLPGNVMLQDLSVMKNVYMNDSGCTTLGYSCQQLTDMGPGYFERFFPQEEVIALTSALTGLVTVDDRTRTTSFYQRVRTGRRQEYKWYHTMSRLCNGPISQDRNCIMHISIEAGSMLTASRQLSAVIDENTFVQRNYQRFCSLTRREREIIKLIAEGTSCWDISEMLFISLHTVHNHRKNISRKLDTKSLSQLIRFAVEFKLIY